MSTLSIKLMPQLMLQDIHIQATDYTKKNISKVPMDITKSFKMLWKCDVNGLFLLIMLLLIITDLDRQYL